MLLIYCSYPLEIYKSHKNDDFEKKASVLRAMNEVLTCPFFEIRQFTPEEINTEFAKPSNGFRKHHRMLNALENMLRDWINEIRHKTKKLCVR